ncbi:diphthine--ammonia ligase isoform X4 [Physcomitrium patens]|uniref:diphthine--ammonia ligase isoform X4 n=1 Tax=Physcomitrium patens TaxID=3218 RepID=UPI000D16A364|nr:diphthine--ammonia ligase-like isoform X4 [Physcomitrium patens]|eukprot:XP_024389011.1 diphthine--ammonia ligase-like isoform X4 [Physcomitrella patens]
MYGPAVVSPAHSRLQELRYKKTDGDEVEDLEKLLMAVKQKHPDINAVSSGAIASNYQRLRVESICSRLGLISLAYMWEQDQATLLQNMIDSGIHAVLVKVAAIGMDPYKHLGKDLASVQPYLTHLACLYGSNVCGEGGEYESLTLDSPLFKHARIVLDEFEVTLHSPDQIAPVGVLHPTKFHLEAKDSSAKLSPGLLSSVYEVADDMPEKEEMVMKGEEVSVIELKNIRSSVEVLTTIISQQHGIFTICCWLSNSQKLDVQEELGLLLSTVEKTLHTKGLTWGNAVYVRLFLEDMVSFGVANEVYVKNITEQKCERGVPSRCCMQVCLPEACMGGALVEVTAASDLSKQVLHVQSISCWAPSCIGPYSQATLHRSILHMAGQLGLYPPTMALVQGGAALEMQQALKNCEAVARAFKVSLRNDSVAITIYCSAALSVEDQVQVERCLYEFLEGVEEDDDNESQSMRTDLKISNPLIFFVLVPALPKGAAVELEPSLYVNSSIYNDNDSESDSSLSWKHVHVEPPTTIGSSVVRNRTLACSPCQGSVLPRKYGRASICISNFSAGSLGLINTSENAGEARVDLEELQELISSAVATLRFRVFEEMARLSWNEVTAFRVYYDAIAVHAAPLYTAVTKALDDFRIAEGCSVAPTLIPVSGASFTLKIRELVLFDVTAASTHLQT